MKCAPFGIYSLWKLEAQFLMPNAFSADALKKGLRRAHLLLAAQHNVLRCHSALYRKSTGVDGAAQRAPKCYSRAGTKVRLHLSIASYTDQAFGGRSIFNDGSTEGGAPASFALAPRMFRNF